jgi:galactokinase
VWIAARPRDDERVIVRSLDFDDEGRADLSRLPRGSGWFEYVKGTAWAMAGAGYRLRGFEGVLGGEIPMGAGLSSSAALEIAAARVFAAVSGLAWDPPVAARLGQAAENGWVGVQCGIMDPLIVAAGREGQALLIDCRDLATRAVPLPPGAVAVVLDTSTRRGLVTSAYNERRAQCEEAARLFGRASLREVTLEELETRWDQLPDPLRRRARHVVTENVRTLAAADALASGDKARAGRLMVEGHRSLRDDFGVSSDRLDAMVEAARETDGCYGARMTGAGFAGCAIALVEESAAAAFVATVQRRYHGRTGLEPSIYVCHPSAGAGLEPLD